MFQPSSAFSRTLFLKMHGLSSSKSMLSHMAFHPMGWYWILVTQFIQVPYCYTYTFLGNKMTWECSKRHLTVHINCDFCTHSTTTDHLFYCFIYSINFCLEDWSLRKQCELTSWLCTVYVTICSNQF
jgi:hypothetical protein